MLATQRYIYQPVPTSDLAPVSVARVRRAIAAHESGDFTDSALLAEQMDRAPRIRAALDTRVLGVMGLPFALKPSDATNKRKAEALAKAWSQSWRSIAPRTVLQQVLRWELRMGFCLCELTWRTTSRAWIPRLSVVHPHFIRWDRNLRLFRVRTQTEVVDVDLSDPRWVLFARSEDAPWNNGVVRALGERDAIQRDVILSWARRAEIHGTPVIKLKVPAKASEEDKDRLASDVEDMGSNGVVTLAQGATPEASFDADLLEPHDTKGELFESLLKRVDADVSIALLGQNLTTEVSGGSLAAAKVHDRVRVDYLEADAVMLGDVTQAQVMARIVFYNDARTSEDGEDLAQLDAWERAHQLAPRPTFDPSPPEDKEATAKAQNLDADYLAKLDKLRVDIAPLLAERGLERLPEPQARPEAQGQNNNTTTGNA